GLALYRNGSDREAVAEFSKALELKPDCLEALVYREHAYVKLGQADQALADSSRAIELGARFASLWYDRGWAFTHLRQWDQAIAALSQVLGMDGGGLSLGGDRHRDVRSGRAALFTGDPLPDRAYCYSVLGQWDKAADDLTLTLKRFAPPGSAPPDDDIWLQLACLRLLQGDDPGYGQLCRQLLERSGRAEQGLTGQSAFVASRTCALRPEGGAPPAQAVLWAEQAVASDPKCPWFLHTLALAHYRADHA